MQLRGGGQASLKSVAQEVKKGRLELCAEVLSTG